MSNLLFDEPPQMFQPRLAAAFNDVNEAIVLQQIHYWLKRTSNVRDGRKWVYNSMANWQKQFYWIKSRSTLTKIFKDLVNRGLLIEANYNKAKFDRTKWYTIDYDAFHEFEQALYRNCTTSEQELDNATTNSCTTYTIDYTETTTENNKIDRKIDSVALIRDFIDFWENNLGFMPPVLAEDFLYEYQDWREKGVEHDEIIEIFKKALTGAISYNANDKRKYTLSILHGWLNNNVLSLNAIEGEEKQFKEHQEKKQQRQNSRNHNNYNAQNSGANERW